MEFIQLWQYVYWLLLVFARISGVFLILPPMGGRNTPVQVRIGVAAALAILLVPVLADKPTPVDHVLVLGLELAGELMVGLSLGVIVNLVFNAIYVAGQLIDVPMGFGMVNVMDPFTGAQVPIFAQFQFVIATLVFLAVGGHRTMIYVLAKSFEIIPMATARPSVAMAEVGLKAFTQMFLIGVKLSFPVVGALLVTDVALGIVSRAVPQINVFIVGFPLKIVVGLGILLVVLPLYVYALRALFADDGVTWHLVEELLASFGPGEGS